MKCTCTGSGKQAEPHTGGYEYNTMYWYPEVQSGSRLRWFLHWWHFEAYTAIIDPE